MFLTKNKKEKRYAVVTQSSPYEWDGRTMYAGTTLTRERYYTYEEAEQVAQFAMKMEGKILSAYVVKIEGELKRETNIVSKRLGDEDVD